MRKSTKTLTIILTLLILSSLLISGCKGEDKKGTETNGTNSSEMNSNSQFLYPNLEPVKLKWYYMSLHQTDEQMVFEELNKIIKSKLNATVDFMPMELAEYEDKMKLILSSGEPFDLCFTSWWGGVKYYDAIQRGSFLKLDELVEKYGQTAKKTVPEKIWNAARYKDGNLYGIVNYQISVYTKGLWVRKDLAEKYKDEFDVTKIKKYTEIEPFFKLIKEKEPGYTPCLMTRKGWYDQMSFTLGLLPVYSVAGISLEDPKKIIFGDKRPEFREYLETVRRWYLNGYIRKDVISIKDEEPEIKSAKYVAGIASNIKPGGASDWAIKNGYEVVEIPLGRSIIDTNSCIATLTAISKTSQNPERAMMLIDLFYSDKKLYNTIAFGIEGIHYKKVSETRMEPLAKDRYYPGNPQWQFGTQFNAYLNPDQADNVWEETKRLNETAAESPVNGFVVDTKPIRREAILISAAAAEFESIKGTGTVDPDEVLTKYLEKLDRAGADKVIEEVQKQYDEWLKANN